MNDLLNAVALSLMREALCIGSNGRRKGYKNRVEVSTESSRHTTCQDLVSVGLMRELPRDGSVKSGEIAFAVTLNGRSAVSAFTAPTKQKAPSIPITLR